MSHQNFLKNPEPCVCGCGRYGTPRRKVWAGEEVGHVRECDCARCRGGRQVSKARRRENKTAARLGGTRDPGSGRVSGVDIRVPEVVLIEETANKALVAGVRRWWTGKGTVAKMRRLRDRRSMMSIPIAFVGSWDGKPQVAVMDFEDFAQLVEQAKQAIE